MNERRRRVIVGTVTGLVMLLMIGVVLSIALRDRGTLPSAPPQDTNPTGRETPRSNFPSFPRGATATPGAPPTATVAPPRGTVVYERDSTVYLLVLGGQERTLVPSGQQPKIAPDGSRVVYIGRVNSVETQVLLVDPRSRQLSLVTDKARAPALPAWSPDGRRIAFRAAVGDTTEIFTVNLDGMDLQQVTRGATRIDAATQPVWAADGAAIFYKNQGDGAFYRIPAAGGVPTRIRASDGEQYDLAPSPDGASLAFTQRRRGEQEFTLSVMNADGSNERHVAVLPTITAAQQLGGVAWSPQGTAILVASGGSFRQEVWDLKSGKPTTAIAYGAWPSWIAAEVAAP